MTRSGGILVAMVIGLGAATQFGCDQDPARSLRIPRAAGTPAAGSARPSLYWTADMCPPPPEPSGGPSTLIGTGTCAFQQRGAANCTLTDDDLLMEATRPMADDGLFTIYVGVENFNRGGDNNDVNMVVGVQNARGLYRWATDTAHVSVAADLGSVRIVDTHLPAMPPLKEADVIVSGTFTCATRTP